MAETSPARRPASGRIADPRQQTSRWAEHLLQTALKPRPAEGIDAEIHHQFVEQLLEPTFAVNSASTSLRPEYERPSALAETNLLETFGSMGVVDATNLDFQPWRTGRGLPAAKAGGLHRRSPQFEPEQLHRLGGQRGERDHRR